MEDPRVGPLDLQGRPEKENLVMLGRQLRTGALLIGLLAPAVHGWSQQAVPQTPATEITYVGRVEEASARSMLNDPVAPDYGLMGARFAVEELNANGRFLGVTYALKTRVLAADEDAHTALSGLLAEGSRLIVSDLNDTDLAALAPLAAPADALVIDARSSADNLRQPLCEGHVFHVLPSWGMRAEALAKFLADKHWTRWLLLTGKSGDDEAYAAALRRAGQGVSAQIVGSHVYTPSGAQEGAPTAEEIQRQILAVTRAPVPYDLALVADSRDTFGERVLFNTAAPVLVAGTHGLRAVAWDPQFADFAARGLQYRFMKAASRTMSERDYGNWLAVSILGEAVTRGGASDARTARVYLTSSAFSMAAFKGQGLTFRPQDLQLRQPLLLFGPRQLVAIVPDATAAPAIGDCVVHH
jgi:ABC transporter substrate binding protein (PQQ-dependent alcohol dehydrogenase system)